MSIKALSYYTDPVTHITKPVEVDGASAVHNHAGSDITSGTLVHERGGLEADVSAYDGLVKISGGATTQISDNSSDWNTAYGWGNHASAGYLTSVTPHNLLSDTHGDTTIASVQRGAIIAGIGETPAWQRLSIGSANQFLRSDGTDVGWTTPDHGSIGGLSDDDHAQYALLAGRSGGQTLIGGTASGEDLTLSSTSNATKGTIFFGSAQTSGFDEVNGRLGIGTSAPSHPLHLVTSFSQPVVIEQTHYQNTHNLELYNSGTYTSGQSAGGLYFSMKNDVGVKTLIGHIGGLTNSLTNGAESGAIRIRTKYNGVLYDRVRIGSNGYVGIGTSEPDSQLHTYYADGTNYIKIETNSTNACGIRLTHNGGTEYNGYFKMYYNETPGDHLKIQDTGGTIMRMKYNRVDIGMGINDAFSSYLFYVNGTSSFNGTVRILSDTATGTALVRDSSGLIKVTSSSRKYKENIKDCEIDSSKIFDLRPVSFNFKTEPGINTFGLIAEDVYDVIPELVNLNENKEPESVNYSILSVLLINEIKKMKEEINERKNRKN